MSVIGIVLSLVSALLRGAFMWCFLARSPRLLAWLRASVAVDVALVAVNVVAARWMSAAVWVAITAAEVLFLRHNRQVLRREAELEDERRRAEVIASLPPEDRVWVREHVELATIRLADRAAVRRA